MVNSPVKDIRRRTSLQAAPSRKRSEDHSWINRGLVSLMTRPEWVSPVSKKAVLRQRLVQGGLKAATMHTFDFQHLSSAREAVRAQGESEATVKLRAENERLQAALKRECEAKGQRITDLRRELSRVSAEKEQQHKLFDDAISTRMRECHRLKNDLRVMVDRATGYRDERDVNADLVASLQKTLELEREQTRRVKMQLVAACNAQAMQLKTQRSLNGALQAQCLDLQERCDAAEGDAEELRAQVDQYAGVLQQLVQASNEVVANVSALESDIEQ